MSTHVVTIRIPTGLHQKLLRYSKEQERTVAAQIRVLLKQAMDAVAKGPKPVSKAKSGSDDGKDWTALAPWERKNAHRQHDPNEFEQYHKEKIAEMERLGLL